MAATRIIYRFDGLLDIAVTRAAPAWIRLNADGSVSERTASQTLGDIGAAASADLSGYVPTSRTIAGRALSSNITLVSADISDASAAGSTDDAGYLAKYGVAGILTATSFAPYEGGYYSANSCVWLGTDGVSLYDVTIITGNTTANRTLTTPDASGTIALTSQLPPTLIEADVITGTSTTPGIVSPALLKIAAEEHGGAAGSDPHDPTKAIVIECDFYSAVGAYYTGCGFTNIAAAASGTVAIAAPTTDHPGILTISDSTTANGGYRIMTDATAFLIAGSEESTFCFRPDDQRTTNVARLGFQDTASIPEPTDACMLKTIGNGAGGVTVSGVCRSNNSETATASTGTLTTGTWYRGEIVINSAATLATFTIKTTAGATVWTDTVATNIPTGSGRVTGWGISAFETTTDAATSIISIDYAKLQITRTLAR